MTHHSGLNPVGLPFIELLSVDSTNNYALGQVHAGLAQHGAAFFAYEQLSGKGQRGSNWISEKGKNIVLSIVLKPSLPAVSGHFPLSACTSVALLQFFSKYAGEDTKIKWPNDLYWQDRKAGGILIENIIRSPESGPGIWQWAIIGIGININQTWFPPELKNPVSLKQITGNQYDAAGLARELCSILDSCYQQLTDNGFEKIFDEYLLHLYKKNEMVRLKKDNRVFEAKIKGVTPSGQLVIQHAIEETLEFGTAEWLL